MTAIFALEQYGSQAHSAVPVLLRAMEDSNPEVRDYASNALQKIAPEVLTIAPPQ